VFSYLFFSVLCARLGRQSGQLLSAGRQGWARDIEARDETETFICQDWDVFYRSCFLTVAVGGVCMLNCLCLPFFSESADVTDGQDAVHNASVRKRDM